MLRSLLLADDQSRSQHIDRIRVPSTSPIAFIAGPNAVDSAPPVRNG
jgi:hypothetical protein